MGGASPHLDISPPPVPNFISKRSGRQIRMPARYADFLPGTATHLEHMPATSRQQRGRTQNQPASPLAAPVTPSEESQSSESEDLDTSFVTIPDPMGMYRVYPIQPTHAPIDTLNSVTDDPNLEAGDRPAAVVAHDAPKPDYFAPFTNPSCGLLMAYQYSGTSSGSANQLDRLPSFLNHPSFHAPDTRTFSHAREADRLDKYLEIPDNPFHEKHGWKNSTVKIRLPKEGLRFDCEEDAPELDIPGIYHRDMTDIIRSVFVDEVFTTFNTTPFTQYWKAGDRVQEVFSEAYASAEMREAYSEINSLPHDPDDNLERVVASLMMWSDSTHLTSFGDASLWPFYLFFGNESKYTRAKPTSLACHHVAYIPKVSTTFVSVQGLLTYRCI